ncbi:hypothetical protein D3C86_1829530 [compost metagenome]
MHKYYYLLQPLQSQLREPGHALHAVQDPRRSFDQGILRELPPRNKEQYACPTVLWLRLRFEADAEADGSHRCAANLRRRKTSRDLRLDSFGNYA